MSFSLKAILNKYGFKPKTKLGQNFLLNPFTCTQIVEKAGISSSDIVIEIGAGLGALTIPLAQKAAKVIAIEYDKDLVPLLKEVLAEQGIKNVEIWSGDALRYDYEKAAKEYGQRIKIVGNLPYYISSPLLFLFLEKREALTDLTLMLQKEVAERLKARSGSKKYGLLSVLYSLTAEISTLMRLNPASFYPRPEVSSEVVHIRWKQLETKQINAPIISKQFISFLKLLFGKRRKTIFNTLKQYRPKEEIKRILDELKLDPMLRPEHISPLRLLALYERIKTS